MPAAAALVLGGVATLQAQTCTTRLVSCDPTGVPGNGNSDSVSVTPDGRYVAFCSAASNLVAGDVEGRVDVFLKDLLTGSIERLSATASGGNGNCTGSAITPDARFVVFGSLASNLVPNDSNGGVRDVFVRDRQTGGIELVSVTPSGQSGNGASGPDSDPGLCISADGRYVAFHSDASDLVAGDTNAQPDVFVRDRWLSQTVRVSVNSAGAQANHGAQFPALSADGRYVAFQSASTNLVANSGSYLNIYVHDNQSGATTLASPSLIGSGANQPCNMATLSGDGHWLAFASTATDLVPGMSFTGLSEIFLRDLVLQTTQRVSLPLTGTNSSGTSEAPALSSDGQFVSFMSAAWNLVPGDTSGADIFLRPSGAGTIVRESVRSDGAQSNALTNTYSACANGTEVVFPSSANLVPGAGSTQQIYARIVDIPPPGTTYCVASSGPCPCSVGALPYAGCQNSTYWSGMLTAEGWPRVSEDTVRLVLAGVPSSATIIFLQGSATAGGGFGTVLGDGLLCVGGGILRLGLRFANAGNCAFGSGVGSDPLISAAGGVPPSGATRYYQAWYRDTGPSCTSATYNLSNGIAITWRP
jgi:Tol biopolymer transport system component